MTQSSKFTIRETQGAPDLPQILKIQHAAFPSDAEARLTDRLLARVLHRVSLVAEVDSPADPVAVGHILFTPVTASQATAGDPARARGNPGLLMGLAPLAVLPEYQGLGAGSALTRAGLRKCQELGCRAVFVLGHPQFYPRFAFRRADQFGITCEYESPPEAFMALEFSPGSLEQLRGGRVCYDPAFRAD